MSEYTKALPELNEVSREFWKAAREHKLLVQVCKACGEKIFYPKRMCPNCLSTELGWEEVSGKGKLYSYSEVVRNATPGFEGDLPYVVAAVDLEAGVRMLTHIVDCKPENLKCDMPVEVVFEDINEEISIPKFRPRSS